jgi:Tfp pilus assembly protein PilF
MTDEKKLPDGAEPFDWDKALLEWEEKSFVPEVAKDVPQAPGTASRTPASRPLYRPPTAASQKSQARPPPTPPVAAAALDEDEDEDEGSTLITRVPRELLGPGDGPFAARLASNESVGDAGVDVSVDDSLPQIRPEQATIPAEEEVQMGARESAPDIATRGISEAPLPTGAPQVDTPPDVPPPPSTPIPLTRPPSGRPQPPPPSPRAPPHRMEEAPAAIRPRAQQWPDEKPAEAWLDDEKRAALQARAAWLVQESRALLDKVGRSRGLLACSELYAILGDGDRAHALAAEARDGAPLLALAHRQARALMPSPPEAVTYLAALDAEVKMTPAGPARVHSTLLAASALLAAGDYDAASKRLEQAARVSTGDVRAAIARATHALGRREVASASLRLPDSPALAPIAEALGACLRLRGVELKHPEAGPASPNELLLRTRQALEKTDTAAAAALVAQLAEVPELASAAKWLAAALAATRASSRPESARWLRELVDQGVEEARRPLAARGVELQDRAIVAHALAGSETLAPAERVTLAALLGLPLKATDANLDAAAQTPGMRPLAAALTSLTAPSGEADEDPDAMRARMNRTAGTLESRTLVRLGRLLAASAPPSDVEAEIAALGAAPPVATRALAVESAARAGRWADVSTALEAWGTRGESPLERSMGALASAIVAERAGETARAAQAFRAVRTADPRSEGALRALAQLERLEPNDIVAELNALADELGDGVAAAILRIEAVTRGDGVLPDPTRAALLERAYKAAPSLPIAPFLAEGIARRSGDFEEVLRWVRERQANAPDAIEAALDSVREALLVADRDPTLAADRLLEAHRARPVDVALRELCERMAAEPLEDRASWREERAAAASGDARTLFYLEAAREFERSGDEEGALRCAEAAANSGGALGAIARERAELRTGRVARLSDELFSGAKSAVDLRPRREAYERLAALDATARHDPASALLWHRSILEVVPEYKPSLRHVEHHLVGEGRDDEIEPIASAIAAVLRGTGAGECAAHAELAARLRMRGATGSWDSTRDLVELAAAEREPTTWALRMLQAHARDRGDDAVFLQATLRLVERANRPADLGTLLTRAGAAASTLARWDEARALLDRATTEDPGDFLGWQILSDVRGRSGDARGAAEAKEALARTSLVPEHQLLAWCEAGRIWQDAVEDDARAIAAFETAASIDVAYGDLFDRLSGIYAARSMQPELAALLERRLDGITDPGARLAMEVRRGRLLLEVGDRETARQAFESALRERPDDADALSAFTDLCVAEKDWDAAEQALVRLARLLPTADEQRKVYERLGDLYSNHLVNLSRAEVALKEVLKRAPDDIITAERLIDVYRRANDAAQAAQLQEELIKRARTSDEKRQRIRELAQIHELTAHDNRRAEQTLEAARREFPQDVSLLRALAEFYARHHQTPAVNILLDRAGSDARRAIAGGRCTPAAFEVLGAVFDLRGKKDAARAAQAMLDALEGRPSHLQAAGERAFDPRLDDILAPDVLTPAVRALLSKTGDALDAAAPVDLRALQATTMPADAPLARMATNFAASIGLGGLHVLVSPKLGKSCLPASSKPPSIVIGTALAEDERVAAFLVLRALKLVSARAGALARSSPSDLAILVSAWLKCFNPTWQPQGVNVALLNAAGGRMQAALGKKLDQDVGMLALEVAGGIGTQPGTLGPAAVAWGDRVAFLALGDMNAALDAVAVATGSANGSPHEPGERGVWVAKTPAARDLIAFGVTDAFAEARARLGLNR